MFDPKAKTPQASFVKVAECLYRNSSSGTYYALVKRNGKQIRRSLRTQDRKLAERRLKEFRGQAARLSTSTEDRGLTFAELGQRWFPIATANLKPSSVDRIRRCLKSLNKPFGASTLTGLTRQDCETWAARRAKGIAASTFNQDLIVLKGVLQYAVDSGLLLDSPARTLKRKRVVDKPILIPSVSEFVTLLVTLEKLDQRARNAIPLVKLLAYSGMRLGEATHIIWREVDFERNSFTVSGGEVGTKNHLVRVVPLFPTLAAFLQELHQAQSCPDSSARIIPIESAKKAIGTACTLAKLPHFTHHCLRHYFVSNAIEKGVDFKTIAAWIGHKDGGLLVAKTYGHLRDTHSFEMAQRL